MSTEDAQLPLGIVAGMEAIICLMGLWFLITS
jgi:hypothetical protein